MDTEQPTAEIPTEPVILPRAEHTISRKQIDENSLKVLYRLRRHGYKAYLVGGGVRDLLLGRTPKDFDVGTDATPNQVKKLFRNCFLVGRRFRLAHIRFAGGSLIEVATFRRQATEEDRPEDPSLNPFYAENLFGTPRQDAFRRDFTINALFYDIEDFSIIDHVGGLRDLRDQRLRVIGDPLVRFAEDPVRMLRALEFVARLGFSLDETAREAIYLRSALIAEAAPARLREELMELFRHKVAGHVFANAQGLGLLEYIIPGYQAGPGTLALLDAIDRRTAAGQPVTESLVLAALYYEIFSAGLVAAGDLPIGEVLGRAAKLLIPHCLHFHIASGIRHQAAELLVGCYRLQRGPGRRGQQRFVRHPSFAAALAFYQLCCEAGQGDVELLSAWRQSLTETPKEAPRKRPRRRRRRRKPASSPSQS
ncbi:polynucleotide adenylyltransferase PcnB [Geothermobacter hydrogeniphilus]|uniref:Poly(A) polymerase I n=1 Tax=Geothermobacter hydrogeniphilus TaxID=1969733 RepID=A0A1X0YAS6_9BACT|nr:polynucleotide adenylyltransferase PcnB [Geothermobacter hydrogeniphilus]ORJ62094.1 CCA tRNA nucleotidyltransferase [Geothermobacter hydrogeniphilus]